MAKDMTQGSQWKLILGFTLPIMAGNFLQQLYNTADSVIVGWFGPENALGAVGTCSPLTMLFIAMAIGFSTGTGIIVAQYYGAKRMEDLRASVSTAILMTTAFGLILTVVALLAARALLLHVLGTPEEMLAMATLYFRIYALGLTFQFVYNIIAAVLRSLGDSKATLYFLLISSVVNILLDLLFVAVCGWGVAGAAIATVIAQGCSAVAAVVYMFRRYPILRFGKGEFVFVREKAKLALEMGIPAMLQMCAVSMGHLFIQRLVNHYGASMTNAYTGAARLENYIMIPIFAFNNGLNVFVGQNMGAGKLDRVRGGLYQTLVMSAICCIILSTIMLTLGGEIVKIFSLTGDALALAQEYVRSEAPFFIIFAMYQAFGAVLQGAGDVKYATFCTMLSLIVRIVASYSLAYLTPLAYTAIWWALPIAWAFGFIPAVARYAKGSWKKKGIA
jgi:putative MATE family efflux protein